MGSPVINEPVQRYETMAYAKEKGLIGSVEMFFMTYPHQLC